MKTQTTPRRRRVIALPEADVSPAASAITVRTARRGDLPAVIAIDTLVTGMSKQAYWHSLFVRYGKPGDRHRQFLVAVIDTLVVGFVIGEVRDWEFGSPPCGWVFAIDVSPDARLAGVGAQLLHAICDGFRAAGIRKVRTMLARDNTLILSFFRSQGMTTGPFIPLELDLDEGPWPA